MFFISLVKLGTVETDKQLFSLGSELSKLVSPVVNRNRSCLCTPGTGGYTFAPCYRTSRRTMKERQEYFRHDKVSSRSVQGVAKPCTGNWHNVSQLCNVFHSRSTCHNSVPSFPHSSPLSTFTPTFHFLLALNLLKLFILIEDRFRLAICLRVMGWKQTRTRAPVVKNPWP